MKEASVSTPKNFSFDHLWNLQELFYKDRPLMWLSNQNVFQLLEKLEDEAKECREEIAKCTEKAGLEGCLDLLNQDIRQEVSDLFLFVLAIAKCIGLESHDVINDAVDKTARNMSRYAASDWSDTTKSYGDMSDKSRSWDKHRGFTATYYQIPQSPSVFVQ